ncbi:hypothetical protein [Halobacillus faecis]|uniref:Uncharacterized protein n=1 Tax=Halobacillus faecis TaxID=360184 RepID=A0A511WYH4_9BACI|nr:hypothetical protein [Halobacillus faecis]GEN55521.1 hypothetical protein HFA01_37830 [Halobacillus faecis]
MKIYSVNDRTKARDKLQKRVRRNLFKANAVIYELKQAIKEDEKEIKELKKKYKQ